MVVALIIGMNDKKLYLISKCSGVGKNSSNRIVRMHFIGVLGGKYINSIYLRDTNNDLKYNEEYVLELERIQFNGNTLICKIIRFKKLFLN